MNPCASLHEADRIDVSNMGAKSIKIHQRCLESKQFVLYSTFWSKLASVSVQENFLFQTVHENTHFKPNCNPSLIDLILSNDYEFVDDLHSFPPLGKSHHVILHFSVNIKLPPTNPNPTPKYQIHKGDFVSMRHHIQNVNWSLTHSAFSQS